VSFFLLVLDSRDGSRCDNRCVAPLFPPSYPPPLLADTPLPFLAVTIARPVATRLDRRPRCEPLLLGSSIAMYSLVCRSFLRLFFFVLENYRSRVCAEPAFGAPRSRTRTTQWWQPRTLSGLVMAPCGRAEWGTAGILPALGEVVVPVLSAPRSGALGEGHRGGGRLAVQVLSLNPKKSRGRGRSRN
jgi:hypothetical protein